jgi:hypothetical protein
MEVNDLTKEYSNGEVTIVCKTPYAFTRQDSMKNNPDVLNLKEKHG